MTRDRPMERSKEYERLLCEVAPELAMRGIMYDCGDSSPSPFLYRALLSTLLRASSVGVADSVYEVLCAASGATAPARLGLTHLTKPAVSRAVLQDLISSGVREEPLDPENTALTFCDSAGVASSDPDEFFAPPAEGVAVEFGEGVSPLAVTRRRSLWFAMRYFATVVRESASSATPLRVGDSRLWACLVDHLRLCVGRIQRDTLNAAQDFFAAALAVEGEYVRTNVGTRLVSAFQDLAAKDPESLMLYISTLGDAQVKFVTCAMYMRQRFGAHGSGKCDATTISPLTFVRDFMEIEVVPRRCNFVIPVVLTGLAQAWFDVAKPECIQVSGGIVRAGSLLGQLQERIEKCQPTMQYETDFLLVIMAITSRILVANGGPGAGDGE